MSVRVLQPAMHSDGKPEWPGAVWVGAIDEDLIRTTAANTAARLENGAGYRSARFLVRAGPRIRGFIELPVTDGHVGFRSLRAHMDALPAALPPADAISLPQFTIVICTRDRAQRLRGALTSVLKLDYPDFDVVIVDNAAASTETIDMVAREFASQRIRVVSEPTAGLSYARNTGLRYASGTFVAYTDDDVVVDPHWLRGLASGFARGDRVDCVCGLVPSGELRSEVQAFFDARESWSRNLVAREYSLADPPKNLPMFPFSVGEFGTGANFALRRTSALMMGGFDTAFGAGSPTGGGEDLDLFTRVLCGGAVLVVEPDAVVWHRHRSDLAALRVQARGYGIGLGAWLTKIALNPRTLTMAVRRSPGALLRLPKKGNSSRPPTRNAADVRDPAPSTELTAAISRVGWYVLAGVLKGPWWYFQQRRAGEGVIPFVFRNKIVQRPPAA
ncbi:MAG: glycosyltransferase [Cryobacterium sp.]